MSKKYKIYELIDIFNTIHDSKYKYTIEEYNNNKQSIDIQCYNGHLFKMSISQHLKGYGCPYCSGYKKDHKEILNEIMITHKNKYGYPDFEYSKYSDFIKIICPEHGLFHQKLTYHRNGNGCPMCSKTIKKTNDEFISLCKKIDNKLDYSKVNYVNNKTEVDIICPDHGLIKITPNLIISKIKNNKYICSKCFSNEKRFNLFLKKARDKYNDRFNYYDFIDDQTKLKIEDIETSQIIFQTPIYHIKCDYFYNKRNTSDFILKSRSIHGDKYIYDESIYTGSKDKISIICRKHGKFDQISGNHLKGAGCPKCNRFNIKESTLSKFITDNYTGEIIISDRKILGGKELDIYLPNLNLAFEFNGLYWHSELYKSPNYHLDKTKDCERLNIQLIHIWEDDWNTRRKIVESMILNKLGKSERIFARKCEILEISDNKIIRNFLNINHIQGFVGSRIKLGLVYNNEIVGIMTFGNLRKSLGQISKEGSWELLRFCNKLNTSIIGGSSRLFSYFIKNYKPTEIISYSDNSRSNGNMYEKLGFNFDHTSDPNYFYIVDGSRRHRFNFRKDKLVREGFDINKTEVQIMRDRGYFRIFDCGSKKWSIRYVI